jgi:uncharacterized lipoprotein YmbA
MRSFSSPIRRPAARVVASVVLLLCAGCSYLLGTNRQPPKLFVLSATPTTTTQKLPPGMILGLGPVDLPGYLDRRGIVRRIAPNQLEASVNDVWAEPLGTNFKAVLEQNLRLRIPGVPIRTFPWTQGATPMLAVGVEVVQFEATPAGTVELLARWALRRPRAGGVIVSRDSAGPGTEAVVAAMSSLLGSLSDQIAAEIAAYAPDAMRSSRASQR